MKLPSILIAFGLLVSLAMIPACCRRDDDCPKPCPRSCEEELRDCRAQLDDCERAIDEAIQAEESEMRSMKDEEGMRKKSNRK